MHAYKRKLTEVKTKQKTRLNNKMKNNKSKVDQNTTILFLDQNTLQILNSGKSLKAMGNKKIKKRIKKKDV